MPSLHLQIAMIGAGALMAVAGCRKEIDAPEGFARDEAFRASMSGKLVVTNSGDDTLSIVDPGGSADPGATLVRLPIGRNPVELESPHHLAASPDGRHLYVNLAMPAGGGGSGTHAGHGNAQGPGYVVKLDAETGREIGRVLVDPNPGDSALSVDGARLFVTHYDERRWRGQDADGGASASVDSDLLVVDTASMKVETRVQLCPAAHGVRVDASGVRVWATCASDELAIVDLGAAGASRVRRVPVPGGRPGGRSCQVCPYALSIAPDGTVWISNVGPGGGTSGGGSLAVFDPAAGPGGEGAFDPARSLGVEGSPLFVAFAGDPSRYRVFVPEQGRGRSGDRLRVLLVGAPGAPAQVEARMDLPSAVCHQPHVLLVSADGGRGHLVCEGDHVTPGQLVFLDLAQNVVLRSLAVGVFPDGIALVPARAP